ncbi:RecA-family ATPase [Novosphingobium hassiacum]|uniref:RecA-family ATPase n=1 Tax=Novosphingobium hassiacum TaxID=173676 RepID=A0A7W6EXC3_9SPHN|nr:RecA-family ATPase [Novosphingobium hassiacum]
MATIHPLTTSRAESAPPSNVEAEAAFLGAMLIDNATMRSAGDLKPEHFHATIHGKIFERTSALIGRGSKVTPVTLKPYFEADEGMKELGGVAYLARLTADGQGLLNPDELAAQILDLAERRRLTTEFQAAQDALADQATPLAEIAFPSPSVAGQAFKSLDLAALANREAKPTAFAIEQIAPVGEVTLLSGPGSAGKSLLGQQFASAAAAGVRCIGLDVTSGPAIYLSCEDDGEALHWRQAHICKALGQDMAQLAGRLHLVTLRGELSTELGTFQHDGTIRPAATYRRLDRMMQRTRAKLVFLDNLSHLFTGNENDRGEVTRFSNLLNRLASQHAAAIILFGHTSKGGNGASFSGSTAWANAVRSQVTLAHDPETDLRTLTVTKANYSRKGEAITFAWADWAFVREDDLPDDKRSEHGETVRAAYDNALFLACLRERNRQQRAVSEKAGANYAPKQFAAMPEAKKVSKERLIAAMDRLFRLGKIERAELWRGKDRKPVLGLRETQIGEPAENG